MPPGVSPNGAGARWPVSREPRLLESQRGPLFGSRPPSHVQAARATLTLHCHRGARFRSTVGAGGTGSAGPEDPNCPAEPHPLACSPGPGRRAGSLRPPRIVRPAPWPGQCTGMRREMSSGRLPLRGNVSRAFPIAVGLGLAPPGPGRRHMTGPLLLPRPSFPEPRSRFRLVRGAWFQ